MITTHLEEVLPQLKGNGVGCGYHYCQLGQAIFATRLLADILESQSINFITELSLQLLK